MILPFVKFGQICDKTEDKCSDEDSVKDLRGKVGRDSQENDEENSKNGEVEEIQRLLEFGFDCEVFEEWFEVGLWEDWGVDD